MKRPTPHTQRSVIQKTLPFITFIRVHEHPSYPQSSYKVKKLLQLKIHKGYETMCDCSDAWLTCPLHGHSSLIALRCISPNKYVDNGVASMAAMGGGLLRCRQRTRGWTHKHSCSGMFTNNCARFKDAETESVHLLTEKLQPTQVQIKVDKTVFKNKTTVEIEWKTKTVRSRVLPILLSWETVAEVFSCKSGVHINNLKHRRAALKINVMGSTPAAQGQRSKNFHFCISQMTETPPTSLTLMTVSSIWTSFEPGPEDKMLGQRRK